jgi:1-acyl-sn-glycerol-3-phosphate acyltransferase
MYNLIYGILYIPCALILKVFCRLRVEGIENIPAGGAVIAPNHQSFWDIPLLGIVLPSRVHFMAKEELFRNPLFSRVIRTLKAFPVKRGAPDRTAIRYAVDLLTKGELLVIFPEGTRSKTGQLGEFEPGIGMIAMKAGTPIVPTAIIGTNQIFGKGTFFPTITLRFGLPLGTLEAEGDQPSADARKRMDGLGVQLRAAMIELFTKKH